jgi:outer membrane protein OmpA-like peptidoglycan-associated protein
MRSTLSQIASLFFGASLVIFILALLIPMLSKAPLTTETVGSSTYTPTSQPEIPISPVTQETEKTPVIENKLNPPLTHVEEAPAPAQSKELIEPSSSTSSESLSSPPLTNKTPPTENPDGDLNTKPSEQAKTENSDPNEQAPTDQKTPSTLLVLGEGLFLPGATKLKNNMQDAIDNILPAIKAKPLTNVVVEGHADNWISDSASPHQASNLNKTISLQRANAVAKILEQKGVSRERIIVKGLGDTVPIASNNTQEGRAKNRRVEIKLSPN